MLTRLQTLKPILHALLIPRSLAYLSLAANRKIKGAWCCFFPTFAFSPLLPTPPDLRAAPSTRLCTAPPPVSIFHFPFSILHPYIFIIHPPRAFTPVLSPYPNPLLPPPPPPTLPPCLALFIPLTPSLTLTPPPHRPLRLAPHRRVPRAGARAHVPRPLAERARQEGGRVCRGRAGGV
jgi:hypothetical protein